MSTNLIGQTLLNQYRVDAFVASGGMGAVYRVWDLKRNVPLAMKVLHSELAEDPSVFKRFQREARALQKLAHPNIVPFYGLFQTQDMAFLLERYVDGPTLKQIMRQREGQHLSVEEALTYLKAISAALGYAHANGVVHCDVKPSNVMVDRGGHIYLTDFGIARHAESSNTAVGSTGTPAYMAPEQIRSEPVTPATDVYALGVMLFEMLTGKRPFRGNEVGADNVGQTTAERIRYAHQHLPPPSPRRINPDIPPTIETIVLKCLEKEPGRRYTSALELLNAVEWVLAPVQPPTAPRDALNDDLYRHHLPQPLPQPLAAPSTAALPSSASLSSASPTQPVPVLSAVRVTGRTGSLHPWAGWAAAGALVLVVVILLGIMVATTASSHKRIPAASTLSPTPMISNEPPACTDINQTWTSPVDGMSMVCAPAGKFWMGSAEADGQAGGDEKPRHKVYLGAFWIDRTEVTNAMFAEFVQSSGYQTDGEKQGWGYTYNASSTQWEKTNGANWQRPRGPSSDINGREDYPVVQISWNDANTYCVWAGRNLPSEAQWEKAARGVDERIYPWGNQPVTGKLLNFADVNLTVDWAVKSTDDGYQFTAPVGSYPAGASPYGALDMAGNVWEWVADWYGDTYYASSPANNPTGPPSGEYRVMRSGSWLNGALDLRTANRSGNDPAGRNANVGFRCSH